MAFLAASVAVVPSDLVATVVLANAVTDKSADKTQSTVAVTRMVPASVAADEQVPEQQLTPRGRSPSTDPKRSCALLGKESAAAVCEGGAAVLSIG